MRLGCPQWERETVRYAIMEEGNSINFATAGDGMLSATSPDAFSSAKFPAVADERYRAGPTAGQPSATLPPVLGEGRRRGRWCGSATAVAGPDPLEEARMRAGEEGPPPEMREEGGMEVAGVLDRAI